MTLSNGFKSVVVLKTVVYYLWLHLSISRLKIVVESLDHDFYNLDHNFISLSKIIFVVVRYWLMLKCSWMCSIVGYSV